MPRDAGNSCPLPVQETAEEEAKPQGTLHPLLTLLQKKDHHVRGQRFLDGQSSAVGAVIPVRQSSDYAPTSRTALPAKNTLDVVP
jgi:hypothetical protein